MIILLDGKEMEVDHITVYGKKIYFDDCRKGAFSEYVKNGGDMQSTITSIRKEIERVKP